VLIQECGIPFAEAPAPYEAEGAFKTPPSEDEIRTDALKVRLMGGVGKNRLRWPVRSPRGLAIWSASGCDIFHTRHENLFAQPIGF